MDQNNQYCKNGYMLAANNRFKAIPSKFQNSFQVPVAHCNPSYSGGTGQEDRGLKPA
jgi:hypothetical protein